ncbi:ATP-dependent RNA helicase HrpA [Rhodoluna limnophila]|uniref:ATP-dependent RNA helicase HrpA n=1 Tax=Rhodoluna limnophila TaxID=232537 RepID=UPI00110626A8|nr:ATP-dependent RNA helicase HrpA [Rhodoluna limnophila]
MVELQISYPADLPVSQRRDEILEAMRNHQVVVIAGATGSGKTTQIPKMCLELGRTSIAHTQPRRIAARAVAERIAEELKVDLGGVVGYQVRFTDKVSAETKVKVMTDGILLNSMQRHRKLEQYDTIIIDEAHERSLNIDFLLGYIKQLLPKRPDLKVIITSATIDPESFSNHFGGAPIIEVSGRTYPIEVRYRPTAREAHDDTDPDEETTASDYIDGIIRGLKELQSEAEGDTLVFLSGESEIRDAQDAIEGSITNGTLVKGTEVLPLYGRLSAAEQHRVFEKSKLIGLRRRIILATNVAETSLTIPNIKYVIDAGTARISRYSPKAKVQRLPIEAISQASANQRAGRAGRTSPGVVIRLYGEDDFESRPAFTDPEILRTNLASVILQAANLGLGDITQFPFLQPPDPRGVKDGLGLLAELGAVDDAKGKSIRLTPIGRSLARLPMEPRFARMLLESKNFGLVREVMIIVAGLTIQDPRERPLAKRPQADLAHARFADPTSDFLSLLNLWNYLDEQQQKLSSSAFRRLCKNEYLNYLRVREWQDLIRQLKSIAKPLDLVVGSPKVDPDGIHKSLLAGLLSQIGLRQLAEKKGADLAKGGASKPAKGSSEYLGSNGKKFVIFPGSTVAKKAPAAIMSAELVETSRLFARMNAAIDPAWAEPLAGNLVRRSYSEPHWEKSQGSVVAYERVMLFGVPIVVSRRMQYSRIDASLCHELFIRHALVLGEWDSKQAFDRNNRALIKQLEANADRARKPQLAPDEDDIYRFYLERIPAEVFSTRNFEGWWRKAKHETPELLTMTRELLLGEDSAKPDEHEHPREWLHNGQQLKLRYRFEPGATDDGVTVDVPLPLLASLRSDEFDWLVPGMRAELVTELLRSLPKAIRRNVVPAADWAAKALAVLPAEPTGSLLTTLAKTLQQLSGTKIDANDFDLSKLPTALKMTYRVVDAGGRTLGLGTDLLALQEKHAESGRGAVAQVVEKVHSPIERDGLNAWDFEFLEKSIESKHGNNVVRAFPALVAAHDGVNIRLFSTESEQSLHHIRGVVELVVGAIASPAKYVESHLAQNEKLAIAGLPYPSFSAFIDDVIAAVAEREIRRIEPTGRIFTRREFEQIRDSVSAIIVEQAFEVSALVTKIAVAAREANKAIGEVKSFDFLSALTAEKSHVAELIQPKFVSAVGLDRLPRLVVYLQAIKQRMDKLIENSVRDRQATAELDQAIGLYVFAGGTFPLKAGASEKLVAARWLIEEFRISLFAQSLGTAETASVQRIKKVLS